MKYRFLSIILWLGLFSGPEIQSVYADEPTPPTDALLKGKKWKRFQGRSPATISKSDFGP
jgi:hypothetical protein